ncbi:outer membrane beta-barrel protein [uncultured Aliiroseovarius sp.]|uniref:outer membrane protein n=1 Tax=uncultured Aliiroseovarius sp. TaxID=1658783 RepID=UPI002593623E|nr:outer membrane beta-barrel protein [uncultured Aliiroseovarius sp.]
MTLTTKTALIAALMSTGATSAIAGNFDPAPEPVQVAAPTPAVTDWSGFFLGAQLGGSWGNTDFRFANGNAADHNIDGFFGGVYGGYDFQSGPNVYGFDVAYNGASIDGQTDCPNPLYTCSSKLEDFGAIRARFGRTFNDLLVYGAAGYAFGNAKADAENTSGPVFPDNSASVDGWTAAIGVQKMLSSNWALRGEVAYYDLSAETGAIVADGTSGNPFDLRMDMTTVSVGIEKRW